MERSETLLHDEVHKYDADEVMTDWWEDFTNLGPKSVQEYSFAFCRDPMAIVTNHNTRLGEDMYQKRKHSGVLLLQTMVIFSKLTHFSLL